MKKIFLCVSLLALSGCATIFSSNTQVVNVKVVESKTGEALDGCSCSLTGPNGDLAIIRSNPEAVTFTRGTQPVVINCQKEGYRQLNMAVGDSFRGATIVNVLFWPGFLVDWMSGAHKKYPSHFVVNMEKI